MRKRDWSKGDVIALIGVGVAIVGCVAGVLAIPGMPKLFHWDSERVLKQATGGVGEPQSTTKSQAKSIQRERDVSSGHVNFGCDQTVSVETPEVHFGANPKDVIAQPQWAGLDNVKAHNQSVAKTEDPSLQHLTAVKAIGSITGLDSQNVLGVKNCPGGGHGELKLHVTWTEDETVTDAGIAHVTIRAVTDDLLAARTILTLKTENGKYIRQELPTGNDGTTEVQLSPGKYLLSAIGAHDDLPIEVTAPSTVITIRVSNSAPLTSLRQSTNVPVGQSRRFLNDAVSVSLNSVNVDPSAVVRATFTVTGSTNSRRFDQKEIGFVAEIDGFRVYLDAIDKLSKDEAAFTVIPLGQNANLGALGLDKILAFAFGVFFILILLFIAFKDRTPTDFGIVVYRVVLALAASGIGAVVPGMIYVTISPLIRAGGAMEKLLRSSSLLLCCRAGSRLHRTNKPCFIKYGFLSCP